MIFPPNVEFWLRKLSYVPSLESWLCARALSVLAADLSNRDTLLQNFLSFSLQSRLKAEVVPTLAVT